VPITVLVRVSGRLPGNVTAKDLMLHLLRHPVVREGGALGTIVEYAGQAVEALSVDAIPQGPNWHYEPKWDGFRCVAFRDGPSIAHDVNEQCIGVECSEESDPGPAGDLYQESWASRGDNFGESPLQTILRLKGEILSAKITTGTAEPGIPVIPPAVGLGGIGIAGSPCGEHRIVNGPHQKPIGP